MANAGVPTVQVLTPMAGTVVPADAATSRPSCACAASQEQFEFVVPYPHFTPHCYWRLCLPWNP